MRYIGVDIVEIFRIQKAVESWGEHFLQRIYTEPELILCRKKPSRLAARFAGKEAVMKALGTGTKGVSWKDIEILSEPGGKPAVNLHGRAQDHANGLGLDRFTISLSDSKDYAIAFVVGETKNSDIK